mmetsp:Transcript_2100/g.6759  ORF Transcript_2100/g.6759 Transcript_2100/m.6759 type:complete len:252 (-) Transcript_2100:6-761(-)
MAWPPQTLCTETSSSGARCTSREDYTSPSRPSWRISESWRRSSGTCPAPSARPSCCSWNESQLRGYEATRHHHSHSLHRSSSIRSAHSVTPETSGLALPRMPGRSIGSLTALGIDYSTCTYLYWSRKSRTEQFPWNLSRRAAPTAVQAASTAPTAPTASTASTAPTASMPSASGAMARASGSACPTPMAWSRHFPPRYGRKSLSRDARSIARWRRRYGVPAPGRRRWGSYPPDRQRPRDTFGGNSRKWSDS